MYYAELHKRLIERNARWIERPARLARNTYAEWVEAPGRGPIAIRFHATRILTYSPEGWVTLNSGGWRTVTTKQRINEFLPRFNVLSTYRGWIIWGGNYRMGLPSCDDHCCFVDGMRVNVQTLEVDGADHVLELVDYERAQFARACGGAHTVDGYPASLVSRRHIRLTFAQARTLPPSIVRWSWCLSRGRVQLAWCASATDVLSSGVRVTPAVLAAAYQTVLD